MRPFSIFGLLDPEQPQSERPLEQGQKRYAPGTEIAYDPALPSHLAQQHHDILSALVRTLSAAEAGKYRQAGEALHEFRHLYESHLYEKKLRFIPYITHCLGTAGGHNSLMDKMNASSRRLDHRMLTTLKSYDRQGITERNSDRFLSEMRHLQIELGRQMRDEDEYISPMYQPPAA